MPDAKRDYDEAHARARRLLELEPDNAGWQRDLSVSLIKVGDVKAAQGDLAGALQAYFRLKTRRHSGQSDAAWKPRSPQARHALATARRAAAIAYQGHERSFVPGEGRLLRQYIGELQAAIEAKKAGVISQRRPIHLAIGG